MFDMFGGFKASKLKPQLKMAVSRFNIASNKKSALLKQNMREVAILLADTPPKEEKARIKAEALIRDDNMIEAYEILQLECELLSERIKLIEYEKDCPSDLVSCVSTLIYAAPRVDIPELQEIRKQFRAKYGKKFEEAALNNAGGILNERVVTKLSVQPPAAYLVQTYLEKICEQHEVDWSPQLKLSAEQMCEPMAPPVGYSVAIAQGTGLGGQVAAMTGQETIIAGDNKAEWVEPPVVPSVTATPYVPPAAPSNNTVSGSSTIATNPTSRGATAGGGSIPAADFDDFAEPDIFIPRAPGQSSTNGSSSIPSNIDTNPSSTSKAAASAPAPSAPSAPPSAPSENDVTKDDDDNGGGASNGGGGTSSSYRDLAARFENLKNL